MSLLLARASLGLGVVSKQEGSSWPPAAPSVCGSDCATVAREAEAVAVEELSCSACWGCTDAVQGSLVGWASLAASSWSSDFQIWVACSWYAVLTTRAVTHHRGALRAGALSVDKTLAVEAGRLGGSLATGSVRNNSFSGSTYALAVLISLDPEAVVNDGSNTPSTVIHNCLSWWASALSSCSISVLSW